MAETKVGHDACPLGTVMVARDPEGRGRQLVSCATCGIPLGYMPYGFCNTACPGIGGE